MSIRHVILSTLGLATKPKNKVDHDALLKERIEKQRAMREKHKANRAQQEAVSSDQAQPLPTLPALKQSTNTASVEGLTELEQSIYNQYLKEFQQ